MPAATLELQIRATNQASGPLNRVAADLERLNGASQQAGRNAALFSGEARTLGRAAVAAALGVGALSISAQSLRAAVGNTIGAAVAFESSFAGIRKTMDATEEEFARIAAANRAMARELPIGVNEINRIGELAGQLGVRGVDNLLKFERTIADLANTTNLTAEEAATAFAQIANVMQLPISSIDRLGASVVELGNNFATTERDIVAFSQRIAGAGRIAGLSSADVAGIATAFASVGVEAEAGGTAIQKVLIDIRTAVAEGNADLAVFARTAGMAVSEFAELARTDPAQAFVRFVEGLGQAGDQAVGILRELGLEDQRLVRAFLGVANAGDLLRRAVQTSNQAFLENSALAEEANKRYSTMEGRLRVLQNRAADLGISLGQALAPAVMQLAAGLDRALAGAEPLVPVIGALAREVPLMVAAFAAFIALRVGAVAATYAAQFLQLAGAIGAVNAASVALTGRFGALGAALRSPVALVGGLSLALIGADVAVRRFTGAGLLEHLTGAADRARRAERAQQAHNEALREYELLLRQGMSAEQARVTVLENEVARLDDLNRELERRRELFAERLGGATSPALQRLADERALESMGRDIDAAVTRILASNPTLRELQEIIAGLPDALRPAVESRLEPRMRELTQAIIDANRALFEQRDLAPQAALFLDLIGESAQKGTEDMETFADAIQRTLDELDELSRVQRELAEVVLGPKDVRRIELEKQIADLERLKAIMGEAFPEEAQARLDAARQELQQLTLAERQTALDAELLGARLRELGVSATDATGMLQELGAKLAALPRDQRIRVLTEIDQLSQEELLRFFALLRQTKFEIPVILRLAEQPVLSNLPERQRRLFQGIEPFAEGGIVRRPTIALLGEREPEYVIPQSKLPRLQGGAGVQEFRRISTAFWRALSGQMTASAALHSDTEGATNALVELQRQLDAAGMSVEQFAAAIELIQEREEAAQRAMEESTRARIELHKLAAVLGQAGVTGEAFRLTVALQEVHRAFAEAGAEMDDLTLQIVSAARSLDRDSIQRVQSLRERAAEIARKEGRAFMIETGPLGVEVGGQRVIMSGVMTELGRQRLIERHPGIERHIHEIEENGLTPAENLKALADAFKRYRGSFEQFKAELDKAAKLRQAFKGLKNLPDLSGIADAMRELRQQQEREQERLRQEAARWQAREAFDPRLGTNVRVLSNTFNGPVVVNSRLGVSEALDALTLGVR
ncbi:MAG TPA: phage tail tape measure protein [Vicinamibacterales bacterium]|nr:phage tail tape measure protein [Vicinamibacterales bacterium]